MKKFTPFLLGIGAIALSVFVVFFQYSEKKQKEEFPSYEIMNTSTVQVDSSSIDKSSNVPIKSATPKPSTPTSSGNSPSSPSSPLSYSMVDVAKHNKPSDCWTAVNGSVYNVTSWINEHPGGSEAIISLCGIDGSSAFDDQHGGQKRPERELASFKIGALK